MNNAIDILLGMVDDLMDVIRVETLVGGEFVRVNMRVFQDVLFDVLLALTALPVLHDFQNDPRFAASVALKQPLDGSHVDGASLDLKRTAAILVHETSCAANERLVNFNRAAHLFDGAILHGQADAMRKKPRALLRDAQRAVKFVGTNAILRASDEPHSNEPFVEADRAVFHDRSNLERELAALGAFLARPDAALGGKRNARRIAPRAANPVRPAHTDEEIKRTIFVSEVDHCLLQCLRKFRQFVLHANKLRSEVRCVKYIITLI